MDRRPALKPRRGSWWPSSSTRVPGRPSGALAAFVKPVEMGSKMMSSTAGQQGRARVRELADRLFRERYHHLLRIADRSAISPSDAEEAVQFLFMAFIEHFDPEGERRRFRG